MFGPCHSDLNLIKLLELYVSKQSSAMVHVGYSADSGKTEILENGFEFQSWSKILEMHLNFLLSPGNP